MYPFSGSRQRRPAMNHLLDFVEEIGKVCPNCHQNVITTRAVERCVQFKAPKAICEDCLERLLREALRIRCHQKPVVEVPAPKEEEVPGDDEITYSHLLSLLKVTRTTVERLEDAGHLTIRRLDNRIKQRVVPKQDIKLLADKIEVSNALEGIGNVANKNLFEDPSGIVERLRSVLT